MEFRRVPRSSRGSSNCDGCEDEKGGNISRSRGSLALLAPISHDYGLCANLFKRRGAKTILQATVKSATLISPFTVERKERRSETRR